MKKWFLAFTSKQKKKEEVSKANANNFNEPEHVPDPAGIESRGIDSPVPELHVAIKTEWVDEDPAGKLSYVDFGKPSGELGCFLNYEPRTLCPPSERQLNYLKDLGVVIPEGITNIDASCMISRAMGEDSLGSPSASLIALANGFNLQYSAFVGEKELFALIVSQKNDRNRAALYVYGVARAMCGLSFGNMLEDPEVDRYYSIADKIVADPALLKSLKDRTPEDYKKPYRGTAVYKAVITNLKDN